MKTFQIIDSNEDEICLKNGKDLQELYNTITVDEENFILTDGIKSQIIMCNDILPKIKDGSIKLISREEL